MDYIPLKDSDKILWNNNLNAKIEAQGALLGLDAEDIAELKRVTAENAAAIKTSNDAQVAAKTANAAKLSQLKTGNAIIRRIVRKIKTSNNYTPAVGTTLDIRGDNTAPDDFKNYHPKIKGSVMPGHVRINFVKKRLHGVSIYTRLKGQTTWTKLAYDSYSPFEDTRPLADENVPEHRQYMAIGVIRDEEVTLQSNIIDVVFGG